MLKFLRFSSGATAQKDLDIIDKAAQYAQSNQIEIEIIKSPNDIKSLLTDKTNNDKQSIYVCFPFEGKIFDTMKKKRYRIIGPQCVISCLLMEISVPKQMYPISNVAMLGCSVCCSSMKRDERKEIHDLVLGMGGEVLTDFTTSVTHLVAKEVGSKKYVVACSNKMPIVTTAWVHSCWERSKYEHFVAKDENVIKEFKLPIFQGCTICVTGIDVNTRDRVKNLVRENGGIYSGELNMKTCTHLLVESPHGQKYSYARQWKLHCVSPTWLFECLKTGNWIEEKQYYVEPNSDTTINQSLLQKSSVHNTFRESIIPDKSYRQSLASKAAEIAAKSAENSKLKTDSKDSDLKCKCSIKTFNQASLKIDNLSFPEEANFYLDGCHVYLCNKPGPLLDCCRKIINNGGGVRHSSLVDTVTHIVIWDQTPTEVQNFLIKANKETLPHIVSPQWLIDCFKRKEMRIEKEYTLLENENLPNKDNHLDDVFVKPKSVNPATSSSLHLNFEDDAADDTTILNQYLSNNHESTRLSQINPGRRKSSDETNNELTIKEDDETVTMEEPPPAVLKDKTFSLQRFELEQVGHIKKLITEFGGTVMDKVSKSDHIIVPLSYNKKMRISKKELTMCWLEQSLEAEELKPSTASFLYRPFYLPDKAKPLEGCVITVSQYTGMEREHLFHLTELLGGTMQEYFVRNNNETMKASTHLVLMKPEGSKYNASLKWKVPCVSKQWLFKCAKKGKRLPEEDFPVTTIETEEECSNTLSDTSNQTTNQTNHTTHVSAENVSDAAGMNFELSNRGASLLDGVTNKKVASEQLDREKKSSSEPDFTIKETIFVPEKNNTKNGELDFSAFNEMIAKERTTPKNIETVNKVDSHPIVIRENKENSRHNSPTPLILPPFDLNKSRFSFDFTDALAAMESPNVSGSQDSLTYSARRKSRRSRGSLPFEVQFSEALQNAVDKHVPEGDRIPYSCPEKQQNTGGEGILFDVIAVISKKLVHRQTELHGIVKLLGGETRFMYDSLCTHFIHQGNLSDKSKDFLEAKQAKKFVVSPYWLEACANTGKKVPENKFPVSYNPRLSINISTNCSELSTETGKSTSSDAEVKSPTCQLKLTSPALKPAVKQRDTIDNKQGDNDKTTELTDNEDVSTVDNEKLDFQKKMSEIMAATKVPRSRRGRRQTSTSLGKNDSSNGLSNSRKLRSRTSSQKSNDSSHSSNTEPKPIHLNEQSQGDFITYDDPTGRLEREKILAHLKRASPSQDIESLHYPMEKFIQAENLDNVEEIDEQPVEKSTELGYKSPLRQAGVSSKSLDIPQGHNTLNKQLDSPIRPPIALPITNESPKPEVINLLHDEEDEKRQKKEENAQNFKFLLSGLSAQEKIDYGAVIEKLGGIVFDVQYFNVQCTHVIVNNPSRNEKYLASLASGKWVLHKSYLEASREHNDFVNEVDHEWGSQPKCNSFAASAKRWRNDLSEKRKTIANVGAFNGWVVLLCIESAKQPGFKRILEAGGASMLADRPPFTNVDGATHVFIGDKNLAIRNKVDYESLHEAGIWILRPEYISDYLTVSPKPPVFNYVIPDEKTSNDTSLGGKRKANEDITLQQKRTRR